LTTGFKSQSYGQSPAAKPIQSAKMPGDNTTLEAGRISVNRSFAGILVNAELILFVCKRQPQSSRNANQPIELFKARCYAPDRRDTTPLSKLFTNTDVNPARVYT